MATQHRPAYCKANRERTQSLSFPNPCSGGSLHGTTPCFDPTTRHPSQLLALAIGAVYTLIGILGFLVTGFENFAAETNKTLLGFEINPLHNLVHLAIGLAGLALWRRLDTART